MPRPRRSPTLRVVGALALLLALAPLLAWALHPWPLALRWAEPGTTAFMEARVAQARMAGEKLELQQAWVPLEELPEILVRAVLVAEDDRFREHAGIDWEALAEEVRYRGPIPPRLGQAEDREALWEAWHYLRENRDQLRGRSTLTQQLARNLYLSEDRSFVRKAQEALLARRLERFLPKDRILELYLNVVELGPGIFGVEAAAQAYFQRSARELDRFQAASLAGTLPHPLTSNPASSPSRMAWRRDLILGRLAGGAPVGPPPPPDILPVELPPTLPDPDSVPPDAPPEPPPPDPPPSDTVRPDTILPDSTRPGAEPQPQP
jgi:monofunctional glycosyltransferase